MRKEVIMEYVVIKLNPAFKQMSFDDLLLMSDVDAKNKYEPAYNSEYTSTRTYVVNNVSKHFMSNISVNHLINKLKQFNNTYADLFKCDRESLYRTFYIPKKSGGLRRIDAPVDELMNALRNLKTIFENDFKAMYHTSAFAYINKRSVVDAVKRHQVNNSKWFAKFDLSNFFGSITHEYAMKMLSMIFPFSQVVKYEEGYNELSKALSLAFFNGGLPQGTPISPLITNLIMIPVDFELFNKFNNCNNQSYVYTRYADDFIISSKYTFDYKQIENEIVECLKKFEAPFNLNKDKTRYGSSSGSNWNLGVMLNKDNNITIGHKAKRVLKATLNSYILDNLHNKPWDINDVQVLNGNINWYRMVERDGVNSIINKMNEKYKVNVYKMILNDLKG